MNPVISVIVPVYNAEKYLNQCLDSIINQTIFEQLEIIAINDGSKDRSQEILNRYDRDFKNIYVYEQENKGIAMARKRGISHARGQYIAMIDNDDYVEPTMYERLLHEAQNNDADYVYCDYSFFPKQVAFKEKWFKPYKRTIDWQLIERNTQPWNKLLRRDLINRINMEEEIEKYSDSIYLCALIHAHKIVCIEEQLYHYRVGHQSESGSYRGKLNYYIGVCERTRIQKNFIDSDSLEYLKDYFEYRYIYSLIQLCCMAALNDSKEVFNKAKNRLKELNYKKNRYTRKILVNNHGRKKAFVLEYVIPEYYSLSKMICKFVFS